MDTAFCRDLFGLDGRVALVTGASGGIGRSLAQGLARAGARLALTARSTERLATVAAEIVAAGGIAAPFPADLGDVATITPLVAAVQARFGRLDILVNCAGINQRQPVLAVAPDTYDQIMDLNLKSAYFLSQAVAPAMHAQGGGKIINIGSLNTSYGLATVSVYGLSKAAIAQMTRVMAVEWAPHNIQVNCLCPGFIQTDLTMPLWADAPKRDWILARVPAGRAGQPADLIGLAVYLAAAASNFMTGQTLYVDGGFTAGGGW